LLIILFLFIRISSRLTKKNNDNANLLVNSNIFDRTNMDAT